MRYCCMPALVAKDKPGFREFVRSQKEWGVDVAVTRRDSLQPLHVSHGVPDCGLTLQPRQRICETLLHIPSGHLVAKVWQSVKTMRHNLNDCTYYFTM
jgi:hypothetical protein